MTVNVDEAMMMMKALQLDSNQGGPPGRLTIQPLILLQYGLDYLALTGDKRAKNGLVIHIQAQSRLASLMCGLEERIFDINKHSEPSDREAVRSQMRILIQDLGKGFQKSSSNVLRRSVPINIQEKLKPSAPKTGQDLSLHTAVNMWIRNLVIRNRVGDLQLGIERNDQRKLMRLNEIHKFSDGTLTRVMEKLDHMVKDFHLFEYNKGMETRKWSEDDKRRSKDFITAIEKRL
ncbi:hypothetical protein Tco_0711554 [Tanacetum coccineum]